MINASVLPLEHLLDGARILSLDVPQHGVQWGLFRLVLELRNGSTESIVVRSDGFGWWWTQPPLTPRVWNATMGYLEEGPRDPTAPPWLTHDPVDGWTLEGLADVCGHARVLGVHPPVPGDDRHLFRLAIEMRSGDAIAIDLWSDGKAWWWAAGPPVDPTL